jgi:hypothetical protein
MGASAPLAWRTGDWTFVWACHSLGQTILSAPAGFWERQPGIRAALCLSLSLADDVAAKRMIAGFLLYRSG